jgi:hypothetical protein
MPQFVVQAAERPGSPDSFVRALAHASVPVVAVMGMQPSVGNPIAWDQGVMPDAKPLSWAMARFKERHPSYSVKEEEGVVVVMPVEPECSNAFGRIVSVRSKGPAVAVLYDIARAVDPALPNVPPGIVFSGASKRDASAFRQAVSLDSSGQTVLENMVELAAKTPGLVWAIREKSTTPWKMGGAITCELVLLAGTSTLVTSYTIK